MAKKTKNDSEAKGTPIWMLSKQQKVVLGSLLILFSVALLVAFISFYIHGQADQSAVNHLSNRAITVENGLGKVGAFLANILVYQGFGVASFLFVRLFFLTGLYLFLGLPLSWKYSGIATGISHVLKLGNKDFTAFIITKIKTNFSRTFISFN
jgi:S-DNA-T family DNA segregation ATPase FtsK/SpoIIIE